MKFPVKEVRLTEISKGKSKKGNELIFVSIADVETFENETFISNEDSLSFKEGQTVLAELIVKKGFTSLQLHYKK